MRMARLLVPMVLGGAVSACACQQGVTPAPGNEDRILVDVTGRIETGVVAKGNETTGITITASGATWDLALPDATQRKLAKSLGNQRAHVKGTLVVKQGVARSVWPIVTVSAIERVEPTALPAGWALVPKASYAAVQANGQVTIKATGEAPTAGYEVQLLQGPLATVPPVWTLVWKPPSGSVLQVLTPFEASKTFAATAPVRQVTVTDGAGRHDVPVTQH